MATPNEPHEPVEMVFSHRSNQKHKHSTKHGERYRNHWFRVYKCPACGRTASHRRKPIICRGVQAAQETNAMREQDAAKIAKTLAELLAWQGEENHQAYCKRLTAAEQLLKRVAPEILAAAKAEVPE